MVSPENLEDSSQKTLLDYSKDFSWMGHFNKNYSSEFIVAKDGGYYSYLFGNTDFGKNTIVVSKIYGIWLRGEHFDFKKHAQIQPLLTTVSYEEVYNMIRNNYVGAKTIIR